MHKLKLRGVHVRGVALATIQLSIQQDKKMAEHCCNSLKPEAGLLHDGCCQPLSNLFCKSSNSPLK